MGWDGIGIGSPGGRGYRAPYGANNPDGCGCTPQVLRVCGRHQTSVATSVVTSMATVVAKSVATSWSAESGCRKSQIEEKSSSTALQKFHTRSRGVTAAVSVFIKVNQNNYKYRYCSREGERAFLHFCNPMQSNVFLFCRTLQCTLQFCILSKLHPDISLHAHLTAIHFYIR